MNIKQIQYRLGIIDRYLQVLSLTDHEIVIKDTVTSSTYSFDHDGDMHLWAYTDLCMLVIRSTSLRVAYIEQLKTEIAGKS